MSSHRISAADRIRELSAINAEVADMLQSAGRAVDILTNRPLDRAVDGDEDTQMTEEDTKPGLDVRKSAFTRHTEGYYTGLQSIVARLKRQAYALEEAGITAAEAPSLSTEAQQRQTAAASGPGAGRGQVGAVSVPKAERITNGGLGNLDVGWLNSKGNKVGAEKESQLVEEAKKLLEEQLSRDNDAG